MSQIPDCSGNPKAMLLKGDPTAVPLPNLEKLKVIEDCFGWKRDLVTNSLGPDWFFKRQETH
jgi:hypothetical protein